LVGNLTAARRVWEGMGKPAGFGRALVCAGLIGVFATAACGGAPQEQTATAVPAGSRLGDIRPPASAVPLPADRAVGSGTAVYRPGRTKGPALLVTEGGAQYELPVLGDTRPPEVVPSPGASAAEQFPSQATEIDPLAGLSLSPDGGRLLRRVYPRGAEVRDLRGTKTVQLQLEDMPLGWSPHGTLLLVQSFSEGSKDSFAAVDLERGGRTPVKGCADLAVGALMDDGRVLCVPPRGNLEDPYRPRVPGVVDFRIAGSGGDIQREFSVDLRDQMKDHSQPVLFSGLSGIGQILLQTHEDGRDQRFFVAAVDDGAILSEITWPAEKVGGYPAWQPGGFHGDRIMLVRQVEIGSPSPISQPITYAWWNPHADPVTFATFPAGSLVILPGPGQGLSAIG
jgi:hypothetical protein